MNEFYNHSFAVLIHISIKLELIFTSLVSLFIITLLSSCEQADQCAVIFVFNRYSIIFYL